MSIVKPKPSLCDTCKHSYNIPDGFQGELIGFEYLEYQQRYCPFPPPKSKSKYEGRCITRKGYNKCKYYIERCS